jgi:hypothetical protein
MKDSVRLGCFAAFWGDTRTAIRDILDGAEVDYLVADYLSEITMALLARARAKDPDGAGFVGDFISTVTPVLSEVSQRGIKIVTNAGALNPAACARALSELARDNGVDLKVAAVEGDDLLAQRDEVLAAAPDDMATARPFPHDVGSLNAYLGARPIAVALAAGADVVITGRCVDAAVVLGPLMHEFGWKDDEYDLLAAGSLVGHIVECGPQATGGNVTDWASVPGWDRLGYPVAECFPDGTAIIGKPDGTGGSVSVPTVAEQVGYKIGDPGAYLLPDVICDWRDVNLTQDGPDRVRVSGARGSAPTMTYKVTATHVEGYRALTTAMFAGMGAAGKARRMAEALIARTERLVATGQLTALDETSIEVVGSGQLMGRSADPAATEAVVKIGVHGADRAAVEVFAAEFASMALVAQGMTGVFAGRPRVAPSIAVYHLLVEKAAVPVYVSDGTGRTPVNVAAGVADARTATPPLTEPDQPVAGRETVRVPVLAVARARSGDKGDLANIGIIARRPEFEPLLHDQVTAARIGTFFAHLGPSGVTRWALPGLHAINVVLRDILGGTGGTSTLRYDPQGKSYAAMLLSLPVDVPSSWVAQGWIDEAEAAV